MTLTTGTVIDRITRVGDVGEPGYSCSGQSLRKCTYSGSKDDWHGATQDALSTLLPTCYITESVYSYLTESEIGSVRSRIQGIVPNEYAYRHSVSPKYGRSYQCWSFIAGIEAIPLPCHAFCVDGTFHQVHKYPDGKCVVSGIVDDYIYCDGDTLLPICTDGVRSDCITCPDGTQACRMICEDGLWKNSGEKCTPDDTPYSGEPDDTPEDEPDPGEPEPEPEDDDDIYSLFGDIDTKWIIIALIAVILFGILSG